MTTPAQEKLSTAMSQVMVESRDVAIGLTDIGSVHSAVVAAIFNLTIEQTNELNVAMATLIHQTVRKARGKGIKA